MRDCPIETLQPAELTLAGPKRDIAICASPTLLATAVLTNENTFDVSTDSLILNMLYSLKKACGDAPGFENSEFFVLLTEPADILPKEKYDLMIRLDELQIKNNYYGVQYTYMEWEAFTQVHYVAKWSVRDLSGNILDSHTDRDLFSCSSGVHAARSEAILHLPGVNDAWWDMGIAVAGNYAERLVPQWQTGTRKVYMINKFADLSQQAYVAMQNNRYAMAFDIWEEMLMTYPKNGKNKAKSRITHNMAVACEFENSLDEALRWIQSSVNRSSNTANNAYLRLLKERKAQVFLLDQQLDQ